MKVDKKWEQQTWLLDSLRFQRIGDEWRIGFDWERSTPITPEFGERWAEIIDAENTRRGIVNGK
jgi:hypothetical protein